MRKSTLGVLGWVLIIAGVLVLMGGAQAEVGPPPEGGTLPDISLPVPTQPAEQQYLGVKNEGTFKLSDIRAEVVVIEVFSMYCPFCQKDAPSVNELFRLIDQDKNLKEKVKLIGLGAGNSPFEVNTFRTAYTVPFPLFADPDFAIHNALGKVRTPYFIAFKVNKAGSHKVVYSKVGSFGEPQDFVKRITQ